MVPGLNNGSSNIAEYIYSHGWNYMQPSAWIHMLAVDPQSSLASFREGIHPNTGIMNVMKTLLRAEGICKVFGDVIRGATCIPSHERQGFRLLQQEGFTMHSGATCEVMSLTLR